MLMKIGQIGLLCCALPVLAWCDASGHVPYASFQVRVDGALDEWHAPTLAVGISETPSENAQSNQVQIQAAWTLDALVVAGVIEDAELIVGPNTLSVDQYHQYDSIQIYLDPLNNSIDRMNGDDVDLILLPDGRSGVLRGDDLVAELAQAEVPQRQSAPLAHHYATKRTRSGWQFELEIPFASLGVLKPQGRLVKMDVAMNDWLKDHAPARPESFSAETLRGGTPLSAPQARSEDSPIVRSITWNGKRDFGYPKDWRSLQLTGQPSALDRALRTMGGARALQIALTVLVTMVIGTLALTEWNARRRIRKLLRQIRPADQTFPVEIEGDQSVATELPQPLGSETLSSAEPSITTPPKTQPNSTANDSPRDREFAEAVLHYVRQHLDGDLSPAQLASVMNVSLRSLQRRLREGINSSPQELVLAARLEAAHELLRQGKLRVSEVANRVGFADLSYFSRRFRSAFGVTPSQLGN